MFLFSNQLILQEIIHWTLSLVIFQEVCKLDQIGFILWAFLICVIHWTKEDRWSIEGCWLGKCYAWGIEYFTRNQVWELVERPKGHNVIGTKWVFRNKQDQDGIVVRNKARLVAQGYTQVEGLDFGETYALVARLEAIRILLAYACAHNIKLYQMDVKSWML